MKRTSNTEIWIKRLFFVELGILGLGLIWYVIAHNSLAAVLTYMIWAANIPLVFTIVILSLLMVKRINRSSGSVYIILALNWLALLLLIRNVTN